jgi:mono/diheme cytochrome c family protein
MTPPSPTLYKKLFIILSIALLTTCQNPASGRAEGATNPVLEFKRGAKPIAAYSLERIKKTFAPKTTASFDPHTPGKLKFSAVDFRPVLESVYGPNILAEDDLEVLFQCRDGFVAAVPVEEFRVRNSRLAFAFSAGEDFSLTNALQANEHIALGPFYLIWDYADRDELDAVGSLYWPYQVVGVNLAKPSERYPEMTPPPDAGKIAQQGFRYFRQHCMTCHKVNGVGGGKSIDLNRPVNATDLMKADALKEWILDPHQTRPDAKMPALPPKLPAAQRIAIAESIVAYLQSMKTKPAR